jgi:hypothetical protein
MSHSRDYDDASVFTNKTVLVIGGKSSGTDLAREMSLYASKVYVSDRNHVTNDTITHGPITIVGPISHASETGEIVLCDGCSLNADNIVWCTGFLYDFPFLRNSKALQQYSKPSRQIRGLYQLLTPVDDPSIAFIGLPYSVIPLPIFTLQSIWFAKLLTGACFLPTIHERLSWIETHEQRLRDKQWFDSKYHYLGNELQFEYMRFLVGVIADEAITASWSPYIDAIQEIYFDNSKHKPAYIGALDSYRSRRYSFKRYVACCSTGGA